MKSQPKGFRRTLLLVVVASILGTTTVYKLFQAEKADNLREASLASQTASAAEQNKATIDPALPTAPETDEQNNANNGANEESSPAVDNAPASLPAFPNAAPSNTAPSNQEPSTPAPVTEAGSAEQTPETKPSEQSNSVEQSNAAEQANANAQTTAETTAATVTPPVTLVTVQPASVKSDWNISGDFASLLVPLRAANVEGNLAIFSKFGQYTQLLDQLNQLYQKATYFELLPQVNPLANNPLKNDLMAYSQEVSQAFKQVYALLDFSLFRIKQLSTPVINPALRAFEQRLQLTAVPVEQVAKLQELVLPILEDLEQVLVGGVDKAKLSASELQKLDTKAKFQALTNYLQQIRQANPAAFTKAGTIDDAQAYQLVHLRVYNNGELGPYFTPLAREMQENYFTPITLNKNLAESGLALAKLQELATYLSSKVTPSSENEKRFKELQRKVNAALTLIDKMNNKILSVEASDKAEYNPLTGGYDLPVHFYVSYVNIPYLKEYKFSNAVCDNFNVFSLPGNMDDLITKCLGDFELSLDNFTASNNYRIKPTIRYLQYSTSNDAVLSEMKVNSRPAATQGE
ncbi:hypothetical protein [Psittacicella hinzii]|uniref:Uncharacterized protein n=1 Tax=Psittacicella hinzii TaxID=2028575 RepID=A0A3A1YNB8_9GAMM|nr:hypothetical protein [Psittacicella hinzii]RIY39175.1 hypothetical protein CKF58_02735 [Psittacicella hinzii]